MAKTYSSKTSSKPPLRNPAEPGTAPMPKPSLKMLAGHLGLSPSTVLLVFDNVPGHSIPEATGERVRSAARLSKNSWDVKASCRSCEVEALTKGATLRSAQLMAGSEWIVKISLPAWRPCRFAAGSREAITRTIRSEHQHHPARLHHQDVPFRWRFRRASRTAGHSKRALVIYHSSSGNARINEDS
jgi:hypothetical protein